MGLPRQVKPSRAIAETTSSLAKSTDVDLRERCARRARAARMPCARWRTPPPCSREPRGARAPRRRAPGRLWRQSAPIRSHRQSAQEHCSHTWRCSWAGCLADRIGCLGAIGNRAPPSLRPSAALPARARRGARVSVPRLREALPAARSAREDPRQWISPETTMSQLSRGLASLAAVADCTAASLVRRSEASDCAVGPRASRSVLPHRPPAPAPAHRRRQPPGQQRSLSARSCASRSRD